MWFRGPQWLVSDQCLKQKPQAIHTNVSAPTEIPDPPRTLVIYPIWYSDLNKLLGVTQIVLYFLKKIAIKYKFPSPLKYWVKVAQTETFGMNF